MRNPPPPSRPSQDLYTYSLPSQLSWGLGHTWTILVDFESHHLQKSAETQSWSLPGPAKAGWITYISWIIWGSSAQDHHRIYRILNCNFNCNFTPPAKCHFTMLLLSVLVPSWNISSHLIKYFCTTSMCSFLTRFLVALSGFYQLAWAGIRYLCMRVSEHLKSCACRHISEDRRTMQSTGCLTLGNSGCNSDGTGLHAAPENSWKIHVESYFMKFSLLKYLTRIMVKD